MLRGRHFKTRHPTVSCEEGHLGTDQAYMEPETWQQDYLEAIFMPVSHFLKRTKK